MRSRQQPEPKLDDVGSASRLADDLRARHGGDALVAAVSMHDYMTEAGLSERARMYAAAALILRG